MLKDNVTGSFTTTSASEAVKVSKDFIDLSISGTFSATVTLQRSFDSGATWSDVEAFTGVTNKAIRTASRGMIYRFNCVYTSGTVNYYLGLNR